MTRLTLLGLLAPLLVTACSNDPDKDPVAANARQAWPDVPQSVPVTSAADIVKACFAFSACTDQTTDHLASTSLCASSVSDAAERAVPISDLFTGDGSGGSTNERAEYWTSCVLAAKDCAAMRACVTRRPPDIDCQEDGCQAAEYVDYDVSCSGDVATLRSKGGTFTRDCARAFAHCDPKSPTGCTDRPFRSCPDHTSKADRCDGNVRLGCDGTDHVSYHDCERMGGTCGALDNGRMGCIYPSDSLNECPQSSWLTCNGSEYGMCIGHQPVTGASDALCGS